ncbi:MAG TPA: hypothetical protein VF520_12885 [Thermoleophilaceae bacterium]
MAFAGPYVAILSGAIAAWLGKHFPGLALDSDTVAGDVGTAIEFALGAGITWALHHKWLDGWQRWEVATAVIDAGAASGGAADAEPGGPGRAEPRPSRPAEPREDPVEGDVVDGPGDRAPRVPDYGYDPVVPEPPRRPEPAIEDPFASPFG